MSNEIATVKFNDSDITDIKIMLGLTKVSDSHVKAFILLCETYKLDPRLNQISAWEQSGKLVVNVNQDGWFELVNREPQFDGLEAGAVYEDDKFQRVQHGQCIHEYGKQHGQKSKIKGAYCIVHRKDRSVPTYRYVSFEDYNRPSSTSWQKYPGPMIEKVAIGRSIKASFSFSGLYSEEEVETMKHDEKNVTPRTEPEKQPKPQPKPKTDKEWLKEYIDIHNDFKLLPTDQKDYVWGRCIKDIIESGRYNELIKSYPDTTELDNTINNFLQQYKENDPAIIMMNWLEVNCTLSEKSKEIQTFIQNRCINDGLTTHKVLSEKTKDYAEMDNLKDIIYAYFKDYDDIILSEKEPEPKEPDTSRTVNNGQVD